MSGDGSAAERAAVSKLARGSLLSRLKRSKQPLKLVAVPRDHVHGERLRGDTLLAGRFTLGSETLSLKDLDFGQVGADGPLAEQLQGFSWLRDLAAAASREKGARLAEAAVGRWLLAHGARVDQAWRPFVGRAHPLLDRLCALHPVEQRQRLSVGFAEHAGARRAAS